MKWLWKMSKWYIKPGQLVEAEAMSKQPDEILSNCCGATDLYDGNLDNNEGVCADCGEHCEMEANQ